MRRVFLQFEHWLKSRRSRQLLARSLAMALAVIGLVSPCAGGEVFQDPGFASELVTTLPTFGPVGVAWAPDGRMFIWTKDGKVRIFKNGALLSTPFLDFSAKINTFNDNGMISFAFHPNFSTNGQIFIGYVFEPNGNPNDSHSKVSRLVRVTASSANPDLMLAGSEVTILDNLPVDYGTHAIGCIRFADDGTIFVASGEGADPGAVDVNAWGSQDLNSVRGKIFRINPDGTAPGDNPFDDGTNSVRSKVWCYGVRNPYRFSLHPVTRVPYWGELGWNSWEEVNRGVAGGNFGWPCYEGVGVNTQYQSLFSQCAQVTAVIPPIISYNHSSGDLNGGGTCVIGGDFYTGTLYPVAYRNNYFYADYSGNWIHRAVLDAQGNPVSTAVFLTGVQSPTCIEQGPDGYLYYVSILTGQIRRIKYNGPVAVASATPTSGYSPLQVAFSSAGSTNFGGGTMTFSWNFGDGTTSTQANPSHTYTHAGVITYTATLTASNGSQQSTAQVKVTVGSLPPSPSISTPLEGTNVYPGQTVTYQGSATDPEDGPLGAAALKWNVLLHHNTHVHNFIGSTGSQGSFVAQNHGAIGTFSYETVLTATDSSGLEASTSVHLNVLQDVSPPGAPANLTAQAAGQQINLNWGAATDNAAVEQYLIERCQGGGCSNFTQIGTSTGPAYADASLTFSTTYRYRVRAVDYSGNTGGYSNVVSATTPASIPYLVAAYSFDEGTGSTVGDASGNGNSGTISQAVWTATGKFGQALSFNGSTSKVTVNDAASLRLTTGMTLEAWVSPTTVTNVWRDVVYKGNDNYYLMGSTVSNRQAAGGAIFSGTSTTVYSPTALTAGTWSHLAVTYDGAMFRLYVNGTQVATVAQTGNLTTSANPLQIGGDNIWGQYFHGLIDEVRVYKAALSAAQIQADMNTPVGVPVVDSQPPTAPTGLLLSAVSVSQINLSWTASTDDVGVAQYMVERQGGGVASFTQIGTTAGTAYSDGGLAPDTTYSYRVRASDPTGNLSQYSSVSTLSTPQPDGQAPTAPGGLAATAVSGSQINLSWTAATDNVAVTSYLVERQGGGVASFTQVGTATGTTYNDSGLGVNTAYSYRVRATDAAGNLGPYSGAAGATTLATTPGLVAAYSFDEGSGTAVADASGNGNGGTVGAAAWTTAGKYNKALVFNGTSSLVSINDSASLHLQAAMTLEAWVNPTAVTASWRDVIYKGNDNYYLMATTHLNSVPASGGTIAGAGTDVFGTGALALNTWAHLAVTYDGAALRLYVNGTQVATKAQTGQIQVSVNPLQIGGDQFYGQYFKGTIDEVRVYNLALTAAQVQSDMNTPIGAGTPDGQAPTAPGGLAATAVSASQINLSWTASTDNVGVTQYLIERQGGGVATFTQVATAAGTTYSNTGLAASTAYTYRVRASDAAGNLSGYSSTATATTQAAPDGQAPTAPSGLAATAVSASQINLSWTASTDNVGVTQYLIERQGGGVATFTQVATAAGTTYSNTGLAASTAYTYRVRASDAAGNLSGYSSTATATTQSISTGLVAAYSFDEGTGTALNDKSGNGNNGVIAAGTWATTGKYGKALVFNGTSTKVTINDSPSLRLQTGMTLEAWINPTAVSSAWRDVIYKGNDNYYLMATTHLGSVPDGGGIFAGAGSDLFGTTAIALNTWVHLATTYDGTTLRLFVNGVQVASKAQTGSIMTSANPLQIGGDDIFGQFFKGTIDEVRVYNVALTAAQIQSDMSAPLP